MAARAIWKGSLRFASESLPVKLYSAVEDRTIHFHVLETSTMQRIKQQMVNPATGEALPKEQIQRGYEVERGTYVLLSEEEIAQSLPKESRDIDVKQFVPIGHIDQQWYDRPYFLGPDEEAPARYFAMAAALANSKRLGIAHWVMRKKRYIGALTAENGYLLLVTIRHAEEVLTAKDLPRPGGGAPSAKELKMAEDLVSALQDDFRPEDYRDEYRERVMKFVEAKAQGHAPRLKLVPRKKETKSLVTSLAASISAAKRYREKAVA